MFWPSEQSRLAPWLTMRTIVLVYPGGTVVGTLLVPVIAVRIVYATSTAT